MKKIITALLNKTVNEKLKNYKDIQVVMNDIQYQEGIIEALEINNDIEFIILSELLPGEYELKELIEKIKQKKNEIKIIIILEKENKELENYLLAKGNINIFYNNEIEIKEIAKLIINKNKNEELENEIKELKKIIMNKNENKEQIKNTNLENQNKINFVKEKNNKITITENEKREIEDEIEKEYKNKFFNNKIINKITAKIKKEEIKVDGKLIIISGIAGVGKSVFTVNIAKELEKQKKKILIIDFDSINNSIKILLGIKEKNKTPNNHENIQNENLYYNNQNIENYKKEIIKINSKIKLMQNINQNEINDLQFLKIIKEFKKEFDFIIIDLNYNEKYLKSCIEECDKMIFITEPNILQIKKSKTILEKYINEYKIENEKLYILFNKIKTDCIGLNITKEIFKNYNIIGKINFIKNCNTLINQNMKSIFLENKIKQQYKQIAKKISQNNKIKNYYIDKISN